MNDFPFGQTLNERGPTSASNPPLPGLSSPQSVNQEMIPDFYTASADTEWKLSEDVSGTPSIAEPKPLPIETSTSFQSQSIKDICPPSLDSTTAVGSSNYNPIPQKTTEYEVWDLPSSTELTNYGRPQDLSPFTQYPSHKHNLTASSTVTSRGRTFMIEGANSTSDQYHDSLESSNPSESQALPKRRYSFMGDQNKSVAPRSADEEARIGLVDRKSEAKALAKSSHSIIERKYRDNINTKITQLDQTLSDIRHPDQQSSKSDTNEHPHKTSKAEVLNGAMRYIKQAELDREARVNEIDFLRLRVAGLEKLVNCVDCALLKQMADQQISNGIDF